MGEMLYYFGSSLKYIGGGLGAVIVILIISAFVSSVKKGSNLVLILQEFNFNENEEIFLSIKGRASGFWSWVLSLFDKAPITSFTCNKRLLKFEASKIKYYIPMVKISCVSSGMLYRFRVILLILGVILIIAGIAIPSYIVEPPYRIGSFIVGIFLSIFFFFKKKTMHFGIYISENKPIITLTFKKGIIKSIDNETFEAAANTLNKIVLANAIAK